MKNPLHYQISEYDCGPTSILNGVSFLFDREQIPPTVIKTIMFNCMDCADASGECGKRGTSCNAIRFLSGWLDRYGVSGDIAVCSRFEQGSCVSLAEDSTLTRVLQGGGAAVVHIFLDGIGHYVLLTGIEENRVYMFDPYFDPGITGADGVLMDNSHPFSYNRIVPVSLLDGQERVSYSMGPDPTRECVLLMRRSRQSAAASVTA